VNPQIGLIHVVGQGQGAQEELSLTRKHVEFSLFTEHLRLKQVHAPRKRRESCFSFAGPSLIARGGRSVLPLYAATLLDRELSHRRPAAVGRPYVG